MAGHAPLGLLNRARARHAREGNNRIGKEQLVNKDFVDALNLLAAERNLDKEQLLRSLEEALGQAFERNIMPGKQIEVSLEPESGEMEIVVIRRVVEVVEDEDKEITLAEAFELDDEVEVGMEMEFPVDPERFTRIAVQTTKQVITQKI